MNSRKFLSIFLILVILLLTVVKAEEKEAEHKKESESLNDYDEDEEPVELIEEEVEEEEEKVFTVKPIKTTTIAKTTKTSKPTTTVVKTVVNKPVTTQKPVSTTQVKITTGETKINGSSESNSNKPVSAPVSNNREAQNKIEEVSNNNAVDNSAVPNTVPGTVQEPVPGAIPGMVDNNSEAVNPIAPTNGGIISNAASNVSTSNVQSKDESNNKYLKTTVISLVAVGAVVGVATIGVHAYNKKTGGDRGFDISDIEAQPISNDFGKCNNDLSNMPPEDYNPFNIMNENQNNQYMVNNPYNYKPNYDNFTTTPFEKAETNQNNYVQRDSIFSNNDNNAQQYGNSQPYSNGIYNNFNNKQLPYSQGLPVENGYIEKPVANQIEVENFEMPNSQMPTLVPAEPEIVVTKPEEEPAKNQDGYKQIIPTVGKMEIIETPDFNKMTTSMIEDHINNMELENLANVNSQPQQSKQEAEAGYKNIVPDIQEAVIENFDVEDDDFTAVTDTYRAALRASYRSATDENRFSYRTVDSDHSLLHTMREDGNW